MTFKNWLINKLADTAADSGALTLNEFFYSEYYPHILTRKEKPQYDEGIFRNHFHKTLGTKTFDELNCPSSYKVGHQIGLSTGGSGSFV